MNYILFVLLTFISTALHASNSIREMCANVQADCLSSSISDEAIVLASDVESIVNQNSKKDQLERIISLYSKPEARQDQKGYFEEIVSFLEMSPSGKKSLACFRQIHPLVSATGVKFKTPEAHFKGMIGTVNYEPDLSNNSKYNLYLEFDLTEQGPLQAISTVAHEMLHLCDLPTKIESQAKRERLKRELFADSGVMVRNLFSQLGDSPEFTPASLALYDFRFDTSIPESRLKSLPENIQVLARQFRQKALELHKTEVEADHAGMLSEIGAYAEANVSLYKELLRVKPVFCSEETYSSLLGRNTTFGESRSALEDELKSGGFIHKLISTYANNGYNKTSFYQEKSQRGIQLDSYENEIFLNPQTETDFYHSELGTPILRKDFIQKFNELVAGINPSYQLNSAGAP